MNFALDTCKEVVEGPANRRIHALFTLLLWFAAGGYVTSVFNDYVAILDSGATSVVGGFITAAVVAFIKIS